MSDYFTDSNYVEGGINVIDMMIDSFPDGDFIITNDMDIVIYDGSCSDD